MNPAANPPPCAGSRTVCNGLDSERVLRQVAVSRRRVRAGHHVYRAGQPFRSVHFLRAGFVKSTISSSDGREKVTGFHMRGALLGLESLGMPAHACDAIALEDVEVWEVDYEELLAVCARTPELQREFAATLSSEIRVERNWMLSVGTLSAEQRVAALLLDFGARLRDQGFSATHFLLRMSRAEIGSFLGLQIETVTRALTQLAARGLLDVKRREIRIEDEQGLGAFVQLPLRSH